jgi:hypothetical protein
LIAIGEFDTRYFERTYDGSHARPIWDMPAAFEILNRRPINASVRGKDRLAPIKKTSRCPTLFP